MSKVFKPNELVRVISLPWRTYGDGVISIGDIVTIHLIKPNHSYYSNRPRYAVMKEMLEHSPGHNIGTVHLQSTGLHLNPSRNKREGLYQGKSKVKKSRVRNSTFLVFTPGKHVRGHK